MLWVILAIAAAVLVCAAIMSTRLVRRLKPVPATIGPDGFQEARVVVDKGYFPDAVAVTLGIPVRLRFLRVEDDPCSERVVFSSFGVDRRLPAFGETLAEFTPTETGSFLFTCKWGMYRGKLVVVSAPTVMNSKDEGREVA